MNLLLQRMLESHGFFEKADDDAGSINGMPGGQDKAPADEGKKTDEGEAKAPEVKSTDLEKEKAILLKDVMKWKEKAKNTEQEKEALNNQLSQFNKVLGDELSLEDIQKIISERKDAERQQLEKKGEYDRILQQIQDESKKKFDAVSNQVSEKDGLIKSLQQQLEEMSIGRSFSDSAFIRENSTLPPSIARKEFADYFDNVDGKIVAYDKPRGAKERTPLVDSEGKNKSFEDAIAHLYTSHPDSKDLLKSKRKPGSSSKSLENAESVAPKPKTREEKISAGLEKLSKG